MQMLNFLPTDPDSQSQDAHCLGPCAPQAGTRGIHKDVCRGQPGCDCSTMEAIEQQFDIQFPTDEPLERRKRPGALWPPLRPTEILQLCPGLAVEVTLRDGGQDTQGTGRSNLPQWMKPDSEESAKDPVEPSANHLQTICKLRRLFSSDSAQNSTGMTQYLSTSYKNSEMLFQGMHR